MRLKLSNDLKLPPDAATQTFLVVGKRGSGKSNTAARLVEQLLDAKIPVVVLDPVDSWWGLKSSRDGKGEGHSVYVFGGSHADLPLEAGGGALVAEFLCEHAAPLVLSCKHLSGLERSRFMVDFVMAVYRKWQGGPIHLVLEEAHEFAPQAPPRGEKAEEMLGAFKRLWKLGRSIGIGGTAVTQRPASLHKDITTQAEILVVHRTIGPQDVAAVREWIKYHHQGEEILPELATLKPGEAFVWAPEFPEDKPLGLNRVQILRRETFDSASTPKVGERRVEPKALAPVDLKKLGEKMAATIERAKAQDPRELQTKIRWLQQQLEHKNAVLAEADRRTKKIDESLDRVIAKQVPVVKPAEAKRLAVTVHRVDKLITKLTEALGVLSAVSSEIGGTLHMARRSTEPNITTKYRLTSQEPPPHVQTYDEPPGPIRGHVTVSVSKDGALAEDHSNGSDPGCDRILTTIAMLRARTLPVTREAVARWMGIHPNGGRFNRNLATLRASGKLNGFELTPSVQTTAPYATGEPGLMDALQPGHRTVMRAILNANKPLSREELAQILGIHPNGGRYNRTLSWLRQMGVIPERGAIVPTQGVFL